MSNARGKSELFSSVKWNVFVLIDYFVVVKNEFIKVKNPFKKNCKLFEI